MGEHEAADLENGEIPLAPEDEITEVDYWVEEPTLPMRISEEPR